MTAVVLPAGVALPAHAKPGLASDGAMQDSLRQLQALDQQLADVAWRLTAANLALCPQRRGALGIALHDAMQYAPHIRSQAIAAFGFGDGYPAILSLADGSPAQLAGLQPGDRLVAIDGVAIEPQGVSADEPARYDAIEAVMSRLEAVPAGTAVELAVLRAQARRVFNVVAQESCRLRVELAPGGQLNAHSDERVIQIQGRLAAWLRSSDELALVIAHEMAHVFLGHHRQLDREGLATGPFSGFGANGRRLRDLERQADRHAIFMAARAGFDYRIAGDFWRRLSAMRGLAGLWASSHPGPRDRGRNADAAIAEVESLLADGKASAP
ncbi:MAG: PDZ domain-containing protein [Novosphingobium sp.]|nr:PDZ domain-containing protein [Novosphingobium sp.]